MGNSSMKNEDIKHNLKYALDSEDKIASHNILTEQPLYIYSAISYTISMSKKTILEFLLTNISSEKLIKAENDSTKPPFLSLAIQTKNVDIFFLLYKYGFRLTRKETYTENTMLEDIRCVRYMRKQNETETKQLIEYLLADVGNSDVPLWAKSIIEHELRLQLLELNSRS